MDKRINELYTGPDWIRVTLDSGESFNISFDENETSIYVSKIGWGKTVKCEKHSAHMVIVSVVDKE